MTSVIGSADVAIGVDADEDEASRIGEYLASHGGPFFELQRRLGVLREDALLAGRRAAIFVALAWGVPLVLSLIAGRAFGPSAMHPFLLDFGAWARFFIADRPLCVGRAAGRIRPPRQARPAGPRADPCAGFVRSGGEGGGEGAETAQLGVRPKSSAWALRLRGRWRGSTILMTSDASTWAVQVADDSARLTLAGWWSVDLQRAALLLPAVPRPMALHRLGDAALAHRLARAQAGCDPSGRQGRPRLSRRISERLFDVRVRHERGDGDHRRQARVRSQHLLGHLRLYHHRLARDRVRLFRLSAAGVLEAAVRAQGEIGRGARRAGDAATTVRPSAPSSAATSPPTTPRKPPLPRFRIRRRNSPLHASCRSFS